MPIARRAGSRRHPVALQSLTGRTAAGDGYLETWTTYATAWAGVRPATASLLERAVSSTLQTPITHLVELDYLSAVAVQHRVLLGGPLDADSVETRKLYIMGLQDDEERHQTLTLACEERRT